MAWQGKVPADALALANDRAFALTGGLYSRSAVNIERVKTTGCWCSNARDPLRRRWIDDG